MFMGKRFTITESEINQIRSLYNLNEQSEESGGEKEPRIFCNAHNTKTIHDLMGHNDPEEYIQGVHLRPGGVNSLVDILELLKTMRIHPQITDGGVDLASKIHGTLQEFKPYNYFDETQNKCNKAMDKIIELYKENEHGEELVKDIEKVYGLSYLDPRAKEFLKHGMDIIKGE